jgi:hypothetical protein
MLPKDILTGISNGASPFSKGGGISEVIQMAYGDECISNLW